MLSHSTNSLATFKNLGQYNALVLMHSGILNGYSMHPWHQNYHLVFTVLNLTKLRSPFFPPFYVWVFTRKVMIFIPWQSLPNQ